MEPHSLDGLVDRERTLAEELAKARGEARRARLRVEDAEQRAGAFWQLSGFCCILV